MIVEYPRIIRKRLRESLVTTTSTTIRWRASSSCAPSPSPLPQIYRRKLFFVFLHLDETSPWRGCTLYSYLSAETQPRGVDEEQQQQHYQTEGMKILFRSTSSSCLLAKMPVQGGRPLMHNAKWISVSFLCWCRIIGCTPRDSLRDMVELLFSLPPFRLQQHTRMSTQSPP